MGNAQSSKIKNMVGVVNTFTTNINNSNSTSNSGNVLNRQSYILEVGQGGLIECKSVNIDQTITSNQNLITSSTFQSLNEVKNDLKNMIDQIASSNQDAVAEFLSLSANVQVSEQELITSIKNSIENNISNENITTCQAIATNLQEGRLVINGTVRCNEGDLNLGQTIVSDQESQCLSKVFLNAIADNQLINEIVQKAESEQSAKTIGPIGAFFGSAGGIILIIVVCIVLVVGGYFAYKFFLANPPKIGPVGMGAGGGMGSGGMGFDPSMFGGFGF